MSDALPAATLPLYPGLGQAPNVLVCIPSGMVTTTQHKHRKTKPGFGRLIRLPAWQQSGPILQLPGTTQDSVNSTH